MQAPPAKNTTQVACELHMRKGHIWTLDLYVVSKWRRVGNFVAIKTVALASMQTKEVKANTMVKTMSFGAQISSRSALVGKLSLTKVLYEKERRWRNWTFQWLVSQLLHSLRYICEYVCELLGSVILSACSFWGFVASLSIVLLVHQYYKFKISLAIPKQRRLPHSLLL